MLCSLICFFQIVRFIRYGWWNRARSSTRCQLFLVMLALTIAHFGFGSDFGSVLHGGSGFTKSGILLGLLYRQFGFSDDLIKFRLLWYPAFLVSLKKLLPKFTALVVQYFWIWSLPATACRAGALSQSLASVSRMQEGGLYRYTFKRVSEPAWHLGWQDMP